MIRNYKGATGLKTGSTSLAKYNLSASATRDNLSLIAVIMKAPSTNIRFKEAQKLLDYGFSNYSYEQFAQKGDILKSINIEKGVPSSINVVYGENAGALIKKGDNKNIEEILTINDNISAPISNGQKLGEITYRLNNQIVGKVDLVADTDVKRLGVGSMFPKLFLTWFKVLR